MQTQSNPLPLRLIAYVRVSTNGQATKGDSPAAQEEACREWGDHNGHMTVSLEADNGLSGTLAAEERPGLTAALLAMADGEADGLVFVSLDRLSRKLGVQEAVLGRIWANGGRAFEATHGEVIQDDPSDPMRTFLRQVVGAAAQLDAGMIRMRMQQGRRRKADRGGYVGGQRLHRRFGSELVRGEDGGFEYRPDQEQQTVIARIVAGRADGLSLRAIAAKLNGDGIDPPSGQCWYPATVGVLAKRAA
jgi:DNA invertase Pin-like site-specific DNA recombinase